MDSRIMVSTLSRALHEIFKIPENQYTLFYLKENDEVEITNYNLTIKEYCDRGGIFRIRFCRRLEKDEGRVGVFLLNLNDLQVLTLCFNFI